MNFSQLPKFSFGTDIFILIFLFLLAKRFVESHPAKSRLGVITASWPDPNSYQSYPEIWGHLLPTRAYEEIVLTGDDVQNEFKLRSSRLRIRKILANKDFLTGIHFRFTNDSKYWVFIKALDLCRLEKARNYFLITIIFGFSTSFVGLTRPIKSSQSTCKVKDSNQITQLTSACCHGTSGCALTG